MDLMTEPFPARTKTAAGEINGIHTEIISVAFADKILITVSQGGRLAHWMHVPLDSAAPDASAMHFSEGNGASSENTDLLPMTHLTATTVLGGTVPERDTVGQLYATQIASAIATKDPAERRLLVIGLGLEEVDSSRDTFMDTMELVLQCL
ncbi:hypothetical protein EV356DRAFT_507420 [Viridothelium virens]|uniref:Uncharacterized protein n=1 Tax=Viridothelium virens TaxID=1048519 RepID=A0A6A6HKH3_VIRVR|nr:hypothetical protein EV356DRAFT_507420 [Viridothelium virens]